MTTTNTKPADTIRDGSLKATIWGNDREVDGQKRTIYSVKFARTYMDGEGNYKDADSYSGAELLRLAHLAERAYERVSALKASDRDAA